MKRMDGVWLAAFIIGVAAGLTYSWFSASLGDKGADPRSLRSDRKDEYRGAIAAAYAATGDLGRARARLALLGDQDSVQALIAQAQRALASGIAFEQAQELARLASDLQAGVSSAQISTPPAATAPVQTPRADALRTPIPMAASKTLTASPGPLGGTTATISAPPRTPTRTARPSPAAPFRLVSREQICDPEKPQGLLQVQVSDAGGDPLPGIEISITSNQGEERFFTGLQTEVSPGYADYVMQPATTYSLQVARLGVPVSDLSAPLCPGRGGQSFAGGMRLVFSSP